MAKDKDLEKILEKLDTLNIWVINTNERLETLSNRISLLEQQQTLNHNSINNRFSGMAKYLTDMRKLIEQTEGMK